MGADAAKRSDNAAATVEPALGLFADHLNEILRLGEDMMALHMFDGGIATIHPGSVESISVRLRSTGAFYDQLRSLEASMLARLAVARTCARSLPRSGTHTDTVVKLFVGATNCAADLVREAGKGRREDVLDVLQPSDDVAYLRSRSVISVDCASPDVHVGPTIGESFLVGGVAALGDLMDVAASALDTFEMMFELSPSADKQERAA